MSSSIEERTVVGEQRLPPPRLYPIKSYHYSELTHEDFIKRIKCKMPVRITGFVSEWQASKQWPYPSDHISNKVPTSRNVNDVTMLTAKDGVHFLKHELCHVEQLSFDEAFKQIFSEQREQRKYCRAPLYPQLLNDVRFPSLLVFGDEHQRVNISTTHQDESSEHNVDDSENRQNESNSSSVDSQMCGRSDRMFKVENCGIWISQAGCVTPLHYDLCHGFMNQIQGRKRVTMFDPDDYRYLYMRSPNQSNSQSSNADVMKWYQGDPEERAKHPLLKNADWYQIDLYPGDMLYIPPFHWHHVESLDDSITTLIPWDPSSDEPLHPMAY